jgi:WD40 repeat protein
MPDGQRIATACNDATVRLWEIATAREVFPAERTLNNFNCVAVSPDGQRIAAETFAGIENNLVYVWNPHTGRRVATLTAGLETDQHFLGFLPPDGNTLMSVSEAEIRVWRARTFSEIDVAEKKQDRR